MERVYVAQGAGGLLKVGRSKDTNRRAYQLRRDFIAKGDKLCRMEFCEPVESAVGCEWSVIHRTAEILERHSGREWFVGGDLDQILEMANAICEETRKRDAYANSPAGKKRAAKEEVFWKKWRAEQAEARRLGEERRAEYVRAKEARRIAKQRRVLGPIDLIVAHLTA